MILFRGLHYEFIERFKLMSTSSNLHKINQLIRTDPIKCVKMI